MSEWKPFLNRGASMTERDVDGLVASMRENAMRYGADDLLAILDNRDALKARVEALETALEHFAALAVAKPLIAQQAWEKALEEAQVAVLNERPFPRGRPTERDIGYEGGLLAAHSAVAKLKEPRNV